MATEIRKLRAICRRWGGDLVELPKRRYIDLVKVDHPHYDTRFYEAPFTTDAVTIDWPCRRIVYAKGFPPGRWPVFIHEMGHLFTTTEIPDTSNELLFFGWEWCLAKMVGDPQVWIDANKSYGIIISGKDGDFGDLRPSLQQQVLKRQVRLGQRAGIIDRLGHPKCVPRKLSIESIKLELLRSLSRVQERSDALRDRKVETGPDFEQLMMQKGAINGYREAMTDIVDLLYSSTVSDPKDLITRKKNNGV